MNGAQLHLALNHLPVVTLLLAAGVLAAGLALRNASVRRTALALLVVAGLSAGPAFLTGEPAEDVVENLADVSHARIHAHEEFAEASLVATVVVALLAVGVLVVERRRTPPAWTHGALLVAAMGAMGMMAWTAHLGGQIRHAEIAGTTSP